MTRWILLVLLTCTTSSLFAQTSVTAWLSTQKNGGGDPFPASRPNATIEFDDGSGYGVSVSRMFGSRLAGELSVFRLSAHGGLQAAGSEFASLGDVELTPVMATLQYHFRPASSFDPYIAGGAAYVMTGDLDSADLRADGLAPLQLDEETTFVLGGGVIWNFAGRWGAALDARYLPLTLHGNAGGASAEAGMDPLIVSAGLRVRF